MILKISFAKGRPFCLGLNELVMWHEYHGILDHMTFIQQLILPDNKWKI